jgi:gamma-glutamyl-gamma-aminobutyrate hydrolase PuuD
VGVGENIRRRQRTKKQVPVPSICRGLLLTTVLLPPPSLGNVEAVQTTIADPIADPIVAVQTSLGTVEAVQTTIADRIVAVQTSLGTASYWV